MNLESKIPVKTETETIVFLHWRIRSVWMFNVQWYVWFSHVSWSIGGSCFLDHLEWIFLIWAKTEVFGKKKLAFTHWKELHLARITCAMFTAITEIAVDSREKSKDVPAPASRSASIGVTSLHLEWVESHPDDLSNQESWAPNSTEVPANPNDGLVPQSSLRLKSSKASADPTQPPVIEGGVSKPAASRQPGLIIYWIYWLVNTEVKIIHTAKHHACERLPCCFTCRATYHGISVYLQIWKQSKNRIHRFIMIFPMFGYFHGSKSC